MDVIRLIGLSEDPITADQALAAVADPGAGGIAVFVGAVRDDDAGRRVGGLAYSAHPSAADRLREVVERVAADIPLRAVAAVHRVGELAIGDTAVVVAAAAAHRAEAFDGCRRLIDDIKAQVPIWKHQRFTDGTAEWVGAGEEPGRPGEPADAASAPTPPIGTGTGTGYA
ncbi:molybdopterin synthase catalytic subunit [Allonocardiopsis opalescens]|uniref:Molybdopterin synthase catalytic subunit 1 n=1 Tax=Allonocardiopsis opalescens TaxID=1144618 RepID=A0A2T0QDT5_9ACTN|nr:molybdopterin synthase catalytic subunit [Allonocardiopsis opalescens]